MEEQKLKIVEICNNLTGTINKMSDIKPVESECSIFIPTRIKKSTLISKRKYLIKKYKLIKTDLI